MNNSDSKDQQVVSFLISLAEKKRLEISCIQTTINLIEAKNKSGLVDAPGSVLGQLPTIIKRIVTKEKKILLPIKEFLPFAKLDMKIAHVLSVIDSGFKEDILREIIQRQPELNARKLELLLAVRLSYLIKNDLIGAKKVGRRYQYRLLSTNEL